MQTNTARTFIGSCETQPVAAEGIRSLLASTGDLECRWAVPNLLVGLQLVRQQPVNVLIIDKAFSQQTIVNTLSDLRAASADLGVVVWGTSMSESEALRLLQAGARGLLRKSSDLATVLACIRAVASGATWMEDCVFRESARGARQPHSGLTSREQQVLDLVEQGLKNREIAAELGIQPGTVKIHLKHIFEKTGVHGRYGLAINGMRQRGLIALRGGVELSQSA